MGGGLYDELYSSIEDLYYTGTVVGSTEGFFTNLKNKIVEVLKKLGRFIHSIATKIMSLFSRKEKNANRKLDEPFRIEIPSSNQVDAVITWIDNLTTENVVQEIYDDMRNLESEFIEIRNSNDILDAEEDIAKLAEKLDNAGMKAIGSATARIQEAINKVSLFRDSAKANERYYQHQKYVERIEMLKKNMSEAIPKISSYCSSLLKKCTDAKVEIKRHCSNQNTSNSVDVVTLQYLVNCIRGEFHLKSGQQVAVLKQGNDKLVLSVVENNKPIGKHVTIRYTSLDPDLENKFGSKDMIVLT